MFTFNVYVNRWVFCQEYGDIALKYVYIVDYTFTYLDTWETDLKERENVELISDFLSNLIDADTHEANVRTTKFICWFLHSINLHLNSIQDLNKLICLRNFNLIECNFNFDVINCTAICIVYSGYKFPERL